MRIVKACDICGQRQAIYVCKNCGANVCEIHFNKKLGLCTNCPTN